MANIEIPDPLISIYVDWDFRGSRYDRARGAIRVCGEDVWTSKWFVEGDEIFTHDLEELAREAARKKLIFIMKALASGGDG